MLPADMTGPLKPSDAERVRSTARAARELSDEELVTALGKAHRELVELRRKLSDTATWCDGLETEKDRRSVQRRA